MLILQRIKAAGLTSAVIAVMAGAPALANDAPTNHFVDPLRAPAAQLASPAHAPLLAVGLAGKRLVAVGLRGAVIYSDDNGGSWHQAAVPLGADIVALTFATSQLGWAVGHDGVILSTADGGSHWTKQLDGIQAANTTSHYFKARADSGDAAARRFIENAELGVKDGPSNPFMGVWFENPRTGYVVGSFGAAMTTSDGGSTWVPLNDHIDNPDDLHLFAITGDAAGDLYIASERGTIFKKAAGTDRFVRQNTGYKGSLFGVLATANAVYAYGLRGSIYRSTDGGDNWSAVVSPSSNTITAGVVLPDGRIALVDTAGELLLGDSQGTRFEVVQVSHGAVLAGLVGLGANRVAVVGPGGVKQVVIR